MGQHPNGLDFFILGLVAAELIWLAVVKWRGRTVKDPRVQTRSRQRADYLKRWENREPGFVRCQECREVIRLEDEHDCRNPNPPIRMVMR